MIKYLEKIGVAIGLITLTLSSLLCTLYQPVYDNKINTGNTEPFVSETESIIFEVSFLVFCITAITLLAVWLKVVFKAIDKESI